MAPERILLSEDSRPPLQNRSGMTRRFLLHLTVVLALVLGAVAPLSPALAGKPIEGSFKAEGYPYPQILSGGCAKGLDFSYTAHEFTPPADGALWVRTEEFQGNWDMTIYDAESGGELVNAYAGGWDAGAPQREAARVYLDEGQEVVITACNFSSTQFEVKVFYKFVPGATPF